MLKKVNILLLTATLLLFDIVSAASFDMDSKQAISQTTGIEIHVAVDGNDLNSGTIGSPLATLEGAKKMVTAIKSSHSNAPITVYFHGGTYYMEKGVEFSQTDSGTANAPITYMAYNNEEVVFSGAHSLDATKFKAVTDDKILSRLPEAARGKVGQLDLRAEGIKYIPEFPFTRYSGEAYQENLYIRPTYCYTNLFLNGMEQQIARWPNEGYSQLGKLYDVGTMESGQYVEPMVFGYLESRPDNWTYAKDAVVEGYLTYEYNFERVPMVGVDPENKTISAGHFSTSGVKEGNRWAVINLLEEIDSPGEWYIDRQNMILYYYPPYSLKGVDLKMSVLQDAMITMNGTSHVKFLGLTFRDTCGHGFDTQGCDNVEITSCKFTNIGRRGLVFVNAKDVTVRSCDFSYIGGICVHMNGGNRQTLESGNNKILNCHFYALGREIKTYSPAVNLTGVGGTIEGNTIHNGAHQAIMFSGNDHKILYNEIYDVVKEAADSSAIYAGRDWTMRGTEIAYNYIHDIIKDPGITHMTSAIGVYLDDMLSGIDIHHNIFNNTNQAFLLNCGQDNRFENNIILNSDSGMYLSSRGETIARADMEPGSGGTHYVNLYAVPYNKPPYSTKYPGLLQLFNPFPGTPRGNRVRNNIFYACGGINVETQSYAKYGVLENNLEITEDPGFVDAASNNYNIKPGAEILKSLPGFTDIPVEKIGIQKDEYRNDLGEFKDGFKLEYPQNGQTSIDASNALFKWEDVLGADRYNVTIATDPEMKNVVFSGQSRTNTITVSDLKSEQTSYYWKVEAVNISYNPSRIMSKGAPYLFTTSYYEYLKKDGLQSAIGEAEETLSNIEEGDSPGQYNGGTISEIERELRKAKNANNIVLCKQSVIDNAKNSLLNTLGKLPSKINKGYVGVDNMVKDVADWVAPEDSVVISDDVLTFSAHEKAAGFSKEFMKDYLLYCFDLKVDFGTGWLGFGLKQTKPDQFSWANHCDSYLFIIKRDMMELQRSTGGNNEMLLTVPNTFVEDQTWHDVQIGTITVTGGVRLIFKVDGKVVFDYTDSEKPLKDQGYFVLYNPGISISIRPNDHVPEGYLKLDDMQ